MTIGERIREARTAKGLTQEQLASAVRVRRKGCEDERPRLGAYGRHAG